MRPARLRKRRRRRWLLAVAWAVLVLAAGIGVSLHLALKPERVRTWIREALATSIRGDIAFSQDIEVSFLRAALAVRDVALRGPGGEVLLRLRRAAVLPELRALLGGRFQPREVVLDGPELRLVRRSDGTWNLSEALGLDSISGMAPGGGRWPAVRLRGGKIILQDELASPQGGPAGPPAAETVLSDLSITASMRGSLVAFKGEGRYSLARRLSVSGTWDPANATLECDVRAAKVDLAGPIDRFLPESVARAIQSLSLSGFADLEGKLRYEPRTGLVLPVYLSGELIRCQLAPPRLPFPLKQLGGKFTLRGRTIEVKDLDGRFGEGRISGEASVEVDAAEGITGLELALKAEAIPLDQRLRAQLEPGLRRIYDEFRPEGSFGVEVKAHARPFRRLSLRDVSVHLILNGIDFAYHGFPYRFYGLTGEADLDRGRLVLSKPLIAHSGGATLTVTGHSDLAPLLQAELSGEGPAEPAPAGGDLAFEARVDNLAVDEELREALSPSARDVWDNFQPAGRAQLTVTVRRAPGEADLSLAAFVLAQGVRMSYSRFPYEVTGITGRLNIEFNPGWSRLTLADLRGEHAGQPITGEGVVEWGKRRMFRIDLSCPDLAMDSSLKAALSPGARQLLDDFQFTGRARTAVTIHSSHDGGTGVKVEVDLLSGEVAYRLFPYSLPLAGGHLIVNGEHSLRFTGVVTRDRRPDGSPETPRVVFNGGIGLEGGEQLLDFSFHIDELAVDDRLRNGLPPELRRFVTDLGLEGIFRGDVTGTLSYPLDQPERRRLVYQARKVSARDAVVDFGVKLRRMEAEGEFVGGKDETGNHHFEGSVLVKSASFNRLQLRDADITFAFGTEHPAVAAAREARPLLEGEYRPNPELLARLVPGRLGDAFQMAVRKSELYGGTVQGFLTLDVGKDHGFAGEFRSWGVQLAKAAPDVFGAGDTGATGEARGEMRFSGTTGDPLSIRGGGEGYIERARLVDLPLFVGLWSLLFGGSTTESYFNEVAIRFGIAGGKFRAVAPEGIVIRSQGMHLKGGGSMDFEGKLDLGLMPEFLRVKIPILDQVMGLLKRGLAQVWVTGDLAHPRVRFVTGAGFVQIPIDTRPKTGDRPLPRELREQSGPLPPPPPPTPPPKTKP